MDGAGVAASTLPDDWTVWESPGKPVCVRLSPDVLARLGMAVRQGFKAIPRRGLETGGLLIGSRRETGKPVVVLVHDFEPVESEHANGPSYLLSDVDRRLLEERIAARKATGKGSSIVGFYRSHTRREFSITEEDAALFSTYFRNASDVFLLIKPNDDGSPTGGFIIREGGKVLSNSPYAQFPFRGIAVMPAVSETPLQSLRESQESPPAVPIDPSPPLRRTAQRTRRPIWLTALGVMALAVGLCWGILRRVPVSLPVKSEPSPVLHVASIGNSLRLSWDHQISRPAGHAALWIKDGPETQRIELDSKQLSEGSVVYWPRHSDVEFRFELLSPGPRLTESVRAIGGPFQPVFVAPAPAAVDVKSPAVSADSRKPSRPNRIASPVSAKKSSRRNDVGMASRDMSDAFALPRTEHTPATVAAISLPEPPAIQPVVGPPTSNVKEFLRRIALANNRDGADLPFRVSVEPVPHRSFPLIGKRYRRADYVPPSALRDPGLFNPPHRSVARNVNIDVKVYINTSGKVDYSEVLSKVVEANRDLAALAVFSARRWEFVPAHTREGPAPGEVILHYQFGPLPPTSGSEDLARR